MLAVITQRCGCGAAAELPAAVPTLISTIKTDTPLIYGAVQATVNNTVMTIFQNKKSFVNKLTVLVHK
ncbi:hypothetical protein, partial [Salmonella sp. gx-f7]|uniref:hypothetical protein n=1 Tax=Salmonella sp. gx-f7 TaxID=2582606 RepID=UPI001F299C78